MPSQVSVAFFGVFVGPAVMFTMLLFGVAEVTGLPSYVSAIVTALPVAAMALAAKFGSQKIQTGVVLVSSGVYAAFFIVTFLYELITGTFMDGCFTSPIVITYSLVVGCYFVMAVLHPRQIPDFFYGVTYPLTLPFMFMVLPLYCLFNMDDVSWGTREQKNPNKSFRKPSGGNSETEQRDRRWTLDIFPQPVDRASEEVEVFWNTAIREFLKPMKLTEKEEDVMKKDLRLMKIVSMIVLFSSYLGYTLLMILKKAYPFPSHLTVNIALCGSGELLDFIDVVLFLFVSSVIFFLLVGTFLHRAETLAHIIRTTRVRKKKSPGCQEDVIHVIHVDEDDKAC